MVNALARGVEGDEDPSGKLWHLCNDKTVETVHEEQKPNLFDNWYEPSSPSEKSSVAYLFVVAQSFYLAS